MERKKGAILNTQRTCPMSLETDAEILAALMKNNPLSSCSVAARERATPSPGREPLLPGSAYM